jgi:hypothetical protein
MVVAAAAGVVRAVRNGRGLAIGALVGVDGTALVLSAVFRPDPVDGFPPGAHAGDLTLSGTLHILFGAIGFVAIAVAAFTFAAWRRDTGVDRRTPSVALAAVVVVGFVAGAALSAHPAGIALIWLAVLAQWAWLAHASAEIYRWSPHPLRSLRTEHSS